MDVYPYPLEDFCEGQWWVKELDAMHAVATPDQKRAIAVVHHLLKSVAKHTGGPTMQSHVIEFTPAGEARAMHNDEFPLSFLGKQSIERASEIEFRETQQDWVICLERPGVGASGFFFHVVEPDPDRKGFDRVSPHTVGFATYDQARRVEVAWLNVARLEGVSPASTRGLELLAQLRKDMNL